LSRAERQPELPVPFVTCGPRFSVWRAHFAAAIRERNLVRRLTSALLGLLALHISPAVAHEKIGSASTVSNKVEGILVGASARNLESGSEVYLNELVRTGDRAVARLVFLDNTDLRLGPKSEVTLDRFVYDPAAGAGSVVVRAGLGIFRFVTGSQRPQNYQIQTPVASIGVRGTIFDLLVRPDRMTVILVSGRILVTTLQGRVVPLTQPGMSITVLASGAVTGPTNWRGPIHVDFANAQFPFFEPVDTAGRPVVKPSSRSEPVADPPPKRRKQIHNFTPERKTHIHIRNPGDRPRVHLGWPHAHKSHGSAVLRWGMLGRRR
jgi:FecR protein